LGSGDFGYGVITVIDQALRQDISNPFEFLQLYLLFFHGTSTDGLGFRRKHPSAHALLIRSIAISEPAGASRDGECKGLIVQGKMEVDWAVEEKSVGGGRHN
jgi:hypothetical protein